MNFESIEPEQTSELEEKGQKKGERPEPARRAFLRQLGATAAGVVVAGSVTEKLAEAAGQESERELSFEELKQEWREYKELIRKARVRENIAAIQKVYGKAADRMLFSPVGQLQQLDMLERLEAEDPNLESRESQLVMHIAVEDYRMFWDRRSFDRINAEREERMGLRAFFKGFEQLSTLDGETVQRILEQRHPKRWLYGNIYVYEYVPEKRFAKTFQKGGEAFANGMNNIFVKSGDSRVVIYADPGNATFLQTGLWNTLDHEIAHHNDWENNNCLPIHERLQFLREMTDRIGASDRYPDPYVFETIPKELAEEGPEAIRYRQAQEYWATIVEIVDMEERAHTKVFKKNYPKDDKLVERWRKRMVESPER